MIAIFDDLDEIDARLYSFEERMSKRFDRLDHSLESMQKLTVQQIETLEQSVAAAVRSVVVGVILTMATVIGALLVQVAVTT